MKKTHSPHLPPQRRQSRRRANPPRLDHAAGPLPQDQGALGQHHLPFPQAGHPCGEKEEAPEEAEAAERNAHLAYGLGWISVGHAGKLNAIGHQNTFDARHHPAVATLRKLLAELPHLSIQIEVQIGNYLPSRGVHEDFELKEYDLDILIKRGRLRQTF